MLIEMGVAYGVIKAAQIAMYKFGETAPGKALSDEIDRTAQDIGDLSSLVAKLIREGKIKGQLKHDLEFLEREYRTGGIDGIEYARRVELTVKQAADQVNSLDGKTLRSEWAAVSTEAVVNVAAKTAGAIGASARAVSSSMKAWDDEILREKYEKFEAASKRLRIDVANETLVWLSRVAARLHVDERTDFTESERVFMAMQNVSKSIWKDASEGVRNSARPIVGHCAHCQRDQVLDSLYFGQTKHSCFKCGRSLEDFRLADPNAECSRRARAKLAIRRRMAPFLQPQVIVLVLVLSATVLWAGLSMVASATEQHAEGVVSVSDYGDSVVVTLDNGTQVHLRSGEHGWLESGDEVSMVRNYFTSWRVSE